MTLNVVLFASEFFYGSACNRFCGRFCFGKMALRRPTNLVVFALVGAFTLAIILFQQSWRVGSPRPNFTNLTPASSDRLIDHVHNNTLGFEKIFVVGLPSRTERRDSMVLSAALSNIEIEFIDGVLGETVPDKSIPSGPDWKRPPDANVGSWRAHMNAVQEIVRRNLASALILEDDADWDVRIREQLQSFALSSQALTQPLQGGKGKYADSTYPRPSDASSEPAESLSFGGLPATLPPQISPYGDDWDLLWIGHCGMHFPFADNKIAPKGRVVHSNDRTVPQKQYLWTVSDVDDLKEQYPNHTRVVHHHEDGICSLGYAVSQKGARKLLHEVGLKTVNDSFDIMLRWYCNGAKGRRYHTCLTLQPSLFHHHRFVGPKSYTSDISNHGDGFQEKAETTVIRWSVRMNTEAILAGEPLVDQWPDIE